ncbi:MAG: hypothetical protein ACOYLR_06210 [Chlorobium sp.]
MPFAVAMMLTFQRDGFLLIAGMYFPFDYLFNLYIVAVAFFLLTPHFTLNGNEPLMRRYIPLILFIIWILIRGIVLGNEMYAPNHTKLLSCLAGIILGVHTMRWDLPLLRRSLVILNLIFILLIIIFIPSTLLGIGGNNNLGISARLGEDISGGILVVFPRTAYTLVIACFACFMIEKNIYFRLLSFVSMLFPLILGFSTGGRGGLFGFAVAIVIVFFGIQIVSGNKKKFLSVSLQVLLMGLTYGAYIIAVNYFPLLADRVNSGDDSGRYLIWEDMLKNISLFGSGPIEIYAHNLFIEAIHDYGIIGFILLLILLFSTLSQLWAAWRYRADMELVWLSAIIALQLVSQQFSLDLFWGYFWTAIVLPLSLNISPNSTEAFYVLPKDNDSLFLIKC